MSGLSSSLFLATVIFSCHEKLLSAFCCSAGFVLSFLADLFVAVKEESKN